MCEINTFMSTTRCIDFTVALQFEYQDFQQLVLQIISQVHLQKQTNKRTHIWG